MERYLLFDVSPHEQFNKQRRALVFFLALAQKTNRTLVVPRARFGLPTSPKKAYQPLQNILNLSHLNQHFHPVQDLDSHLLKHDASVSVLIPQGTSCTNLQPRSQVDFNGLKLTAARVQCEKHLEHNVERMRAMLDESIAFSNVLNQHSRAASLAIRPNVRFVRDLYDEAAAYVERTFGGESFLAVHWRRTDFLQVRRTQPGVLVGVKQLVLHAQRVMDEKGLKFLYLATDSQDGEELRHLYTKIQFKRLDHKPSPSQSLINVGKTANLEIIICSMANLFLGTQTSSFTLTILEERTSVFGHSPETGIEMGKENVENLLKAQPSPREEL